jgi:hypothetical protein
MNLGSVNPGKYKWPGLSKLGLNSKIRIAGMCIGEVRTGPLKEIDHKSMIFF